MQSTASGKTPFTKGLRIMKITALLLLIILQAAARPPASAQVTLKETSAPLEKVLKAIKKQSAYDLFFDENLVKAKGRPVAVTLNNVTVEEALQRVFKEQDKLTYSLNGRIISIKEKKEESKLTSDLNPAVALPIPLPPTVHGRITNEKGEPVAGVSISIKGGKTIGVTNDNGEFTLTNVIDNAVLVFSAINTETLEIKLNGRSELAFSLKTKTSVLDEVIVNKGYYSTTQKLNTGSVSTVKGSEIQKQPINNPILALEGRVPGMEITQSNGLPGSNIKVLIRGRNSISQGNDPLYVIDGVPYSAQPLPNTINILGGAVGGTSPRGAGSPFNFINPADIESIDILKDADATAIYGSRGANGVILITTAKGRANQTHLNVNVQSGYGQITRKLDVLNLRQYLDMRYEALRNDGQSVIPSSSYDLTLWDTTRSTDWQKTLIGGTAKYTDMQTSISGGNLNTQYLFGAGFHNETTVFPGDFSDKKGFLHFNFNSISVNQKFRINITANYSIDNNHIPGFTDLTSTALKLAPDAPALYKPDGSLNWAPDATGTGTWTNPLSYLNNRAKSVTNNLVANGVLSYQLFKGLELKGTFGYVNTQVAEVNTIPVSYYDPVYSSLGSALRSASYVNNNVQTWILEPQLAYTKDFGAKGGKLTGLIGTTFQKNTGLGTIINGTGYNSDIVLEDIKSAASNSIQSSINNVYKYGAVFARLNYDFEEKYVLNLTARRDGSSRFGPANKFQTFGALGLAWIFTKETSIEKALPFLDFGKFRFSYGITGNDQVGEYSFLDLYSSTNVGVPYQGANGLQNGRLFTPDLQWEQTRKIEAGLELGFLKDRIVFTTNFYTNRSSNQLVDYALPSITGFISIKRNLPATVQNNGVELSLNTINLSNKVFQWKTGFNFSLNRNKLISVSPGMSSFYNNLVGHPISASFVYSFLGVDPASGKYIVSDSHGNAQLTAANATIDKNFLIDLNPRFYGGIQNSLTFNHIELDFLFQFVKQSGSNYLYSGVPGGFAYGNQPTTVLNRWQKPGDLASIQRFTQTFSLVSTSYNNALGSNQPYSDASFVRLKNLSISYQLNGKWLSKTSIQNARIYLQGQNLLTITNYKGLDPENQSSTSLPPLRVLTFGIQLTL